MLQINQAREIFAGVHGMSFIGMDTEVVVPLLGGQRNPLKDRIVKRCFGANVMVFQNMNGSAYEKMIVRRLVNEGKDVTFELSPRAWGERIPETPFIQHTVKGELRHYLEVIFLKSGEISWWQYEGADRQGEAIRITTDAAIAAGYREPTVNPDSQGGLDNKVIIRSFGFDSIVGLRIDGREFQLRA